MQTATADPLVGRTLEGRYRIVDRIARGGMSTVYSAVDERLDRRVAVKIMTGALSADPAFSDRFAREARAAARLAHVNVVAVYDQGVDSGAQTGGLDNSGEPHIFLVMELVEGRTLRDLIRERAASARDGKGAPGAFSPAEALSIMQPVLSALSAAHRAGIVHRDVKPENILLSDDGVVKVADFGLARAIEADASATRTGLMMGTVAYCAPEQITRGQADPSSDVYASGVVLFELLTGRPPYRGETAMQVAYQHVHSRVPAPSSRNRAVPSEVDELVVLATDPEPSERPQDAGAFLAQIADVRAELGLPVVPIPPRPRTPAGSRGAATRPTEQFGTGHRGGSTEQLPRGAQRHDTRVVPHGALIAGERRPAARPTEADGPPPPVVIPPPKRQRTPQQRRRRRGLVILLIVLLLGIGAGVGAWWFASGRYSKIPDVRSDSQSVAEQALTKAGYKIGSVTRDWSETVGKNLVIATNPATGDRVERGTQVSITLSNGPYRIAVPDVTKASLPAAEATIRERGLQFTVQQTPDDTVPVGNVIRTDPAAGAKVKKSQVVTIYASTGPPVIQIPAIQPGTPADQVNAQLKQLGFNVTDTEDFSDSVQKGGVIKVDPTGQAVKFSTVVVTVSKGPQTVVIPDIKQGTPVKQAEKKLTALGLNVQIQNFLGGANGRVFSMSPGPGETVNVGSTVTLTVV